MGSEGFIDAVLTADLMVDAKPSPPDSIRVVDAGEGIELLRGLKGLNIIGIDINRNFAAA